MIVFFNNYQEEILKFLVVLIGGFLLIKISIKIIEKTTKSNKLDITIGKFLVGLVKFMLYTAYIIVLLSILGVPVTTFVAMISAMGLAIALALQGNLSNFASALVILFFKPFKIGDFIESEGNIGTIQEIQILFTHVLTPDNRKIIIPNTDLVHSRVINYSAEQRRRIDLVFGASYEDDMDKVISILKNIVNKNQKILNDPEPIVRLSNHGQSALLYDVKVWINKEDYWDVRYYINEEVRRAFSENNIKIPYPQREVWLSSNKENL